MKAVMRDWIWKMVAAALGVGLVIAIVTGSFHSSDAASSSSQNGATLRAETAYVRDVAVYANYLALTNHVICSAFHLPCPPVPSFKDPPGLPRLGLPR